MSVTAREAAPVSSSIAGGTPPFVDAPAVDRYYAVRDRRAAWPQSSGRAPRKRCGSADISFTEGIVWFVVPESV